MRKQKVQILLGGTNQMPDHQTNAAAQQQGQCISRPDPLKGNKTPQSLQGERQDPWEKNRSDFKRKISESLFIKQLKPDLNKQKDAFKLKLYN